MIIIALPMYNEEKDIGPYLTNLKKAMDNSQLNYKIIILNDGSKDNSVKIVEKFRKSMPITLLHHEINKGLGITLKDLFLEVARISDDNDIIITMDSDNSHNPEYIKDMVNLIEKENFDLIIASRYEKGGKEIGLKWYRSILSKNLALLMKILFPIKGVRDYSCGYRGYRAKIIKTMINKYKNNFIKSQGFPGMSEILLKLRKTTKFKAKEIPLVLRYDLKQGESKLKLIKTIKEYGLMLLRNKFSK